MIGVSASCGSDANMPEAAREFILWVLLLGMEETLRRQRGRSRIAEVQTANQVFETISLVVFKTDKFQPNGAGAAASYYGCVDGNHVLVTRRL